MIFDNWLEYQQQIWLYCNRVSSCRHSRPHRGGDDFAKRERPLLTISRTTTCVGGEGSTNQSEPLLSFLSSTRPVASSAFVVTTAPYHSRDVKAHNWSFGERGLPYNEKLFKEADWVGADVQIKWNCSLQGIDYIVCRLNQSSIDSRRVTRKECFSAQHTIESSFICCCCCSGTAIDKEYPLLDILIFLFFVRGVVTLKLSSSAVTSHPPQRDSNCLRLCRPTLNLLHSIQHRRFFFHWILTMSFLFVVRCPLAYSELWKDIK